MEFQYAKHLQLTRDHEVVKAKIETLKELPIGIDAFREDLDELMKKHLEEKNQWSDSTKNESQSA